jgi:hypothetical protein
MKQCSLLLLLLLLQRSRRWCITTVAVMSALFGIT